MKSIVVFVLILILASFAPLAYSAGGTKLTTFHYSTGFGPSLFDVDVHFSYDNDVWQAKENHEVGFTVEIKNVNSAVEDLSVDVHSIAVRLIFKINSGDNVYDKTVDVLSEDVSNQMTNLVWVSSKIQLTNTPRSFSFTVQIPEPPAAVQTQNTELYYVIEFSGSCNFKTTQGLSGNGSAGGTVSNNGQMAGGIEDPVWITLKGTPQFPWLYVISAAVVVAGVSAIALGVIMRRRRGLDKPR
jgi:hypothetical protein